MKREKINKHPDWRLSKKERLFYYTGDIARLFCQALLNTFMTIFMLFQGIDIIKVGGIMLAVKIIDAFDDVIFGFVVDKLDPTKSKLSKFAGEGKYLPWYRLTFFLYPLAIIGFFLMPKGMPEAGKLVWFAVFYLLYDLTSTITEVPMNSMVMTLTDNTDERNVILKIKGIISTIAAIFIGLIWQMLISEHVGLSVISVAIVSAVIFLAAMIPMATSVKEHNVGLKNVAEDKKEEKYSFREMLGCLKTNKYLMVFFLANLVMTCLQTSTAMTTFVSFYCYGDSMVISVATMIALVPGLILMSQADKIAKKLGRRNAIIACNAFSGIVSLIVYVFGYNLVTISLVLTLLGALPSTIKLILSTYIIPDTIEYTRYKTGQDCSGIFYSLNSFVTKITASVAQSVGMFVVGLFGWVAVEATDFADLAAQGVTQPQSAIDALWATNALIPAIGMLVGCGILFLYRLKDKDAELMAQCNAGKITREECEAQLSRKY